MTVDKKPSQIIREWPEDRWCRLFAKKGNKHCANGILAEAAGYEWGEEEVVVSPYGFLVETYGIPEITINFAGRINDSPLSTKESVASYYEGMGF